MPSPSMFSSVTKRAFHVVCFPGIGCNHRIFEKVEQHLRHLSVDFHYEYTSQGDTLGEIAASCAERLRKLIGNEKAIAVGHSLGGLTAAVTVEKASKFFRGLVIINARHRQMTKEEIQIKIDTYNKVSDYTAEQFNAALSPGFFRRQEKTLTAAELELLISSAKDTGLKTFLQQLKISRMMPQPNYPRILATLPITVIQGIDDAVIPNPGWEESGLQDLSTNYPFKLIKCPGGHLSVLKEYRLVASSIEAMMASQNSNITKNSLFDSDPKIAFR